MVLFFPQPYLLAFVILAFSFISTTLFPVPIHGASTSNITDHLALMSFKSHVTSDPSQALASWGNLSVPMCQWLGVVCGMRGSRLGRVVGLYLAELNLVGTITPALGNLTYLRQLQLSSNDFHGILPPELGNLYELEILRLDSNSMEGHIPSSLSNCSNLFGIALNGNKLQGSIPSELSSLHNLEVLLLGNNRLVGKIPSSIGSLVNLMYLDLGSNNMTGEMPSSIGTLVNLIYLDLGSNNMTGKILSSIGSLVNLTYLDLGSNNMTGEIPTEIGSIMNLSVLDLGINLFHGIIPESLGNLSALTFLSMFENNLEGRIPTLENLSSLQFLYLSHNKLEGTIPSWLGNLSSLEEIDLQNNGLMGQIPESFGNLELLTALSLSWNNLSGSIPHSIGKLHALTQLYLAYNKLEGFLPHSVFNLSSLEFLDVQNNNLTGGFPPNMGSKLSNLQLLFLSDNQFQGVLPISLCNASKLQNLEIIATYLSGTIPQCLGTYQKDLSVVLIAESQFEATNDADWGFLDSLTNCSNLRKIALDSNKLEGVIPNSVGNLSTRMEFFSIEDNKITGLIPEGIGNLINLVELDMDNNILVGAIPASLGKLKKLKRLSLSENGMSGSIPVALGNLTELITLILSANTISGSILPSLDTCPLQVLDLSHNNLSGLIPRELFSISTLTSSLNLAHNSLSGTLPPEVGNLRGLNEIDLSDNMISNEIPDSIGGCESLVYLNLSRNILQGTVPLSIGNLRGLLKLDLSYNNLSGTIPEILGRLTGLSSLNLSFNEFKGGVPRDGVFQNATVVLVTGNDGLCGGIPQLKLPPCSNHSTMKPRHKIGIVISTCSAFIFVTLIFALYMFYQKSRKTKADLPRSMVSEHFVRVSYTELANATNGFALENLIGAGSFGSVYKGIIRYNSQDVAIAVKVLNLMQRGASDSFAAECETLRCARHRNLVKILTVCSSIDFQGCDFKALVYEFLPNGNLDQRLHNRIVEDGEQKALSLTERLNIGIGVASSLDYLHKYKPAPIIHCDLKPSNVLLDSDMVAHVGDFGLARFLHQDAEKSSGWAAMRGSIGYAAPEYGLGNEVSMQGDVYSYGILLLEMFTGKRPTDSEFGETTGLRKYVQMALPHRVSIIIDQQLLPEIEDGEASTSNSSGNGGMTMACIASILQVGIRCSEETPMDRPPIGDALRELEAIRDKLHSHLCGERASPNR